MYSTQINTKEELEQRVRNAFNELDGEMIRKATTNHVEKRLLKCLEANGGHFEHLIK